VSCADGTDRGATVTVESGRFEMTDEGQGKFVDNWEDRLDCSAFNCLSNTSRSYEKDIEVIPSSV
jgi:hypothetical protein